MAASNSANEISNHYDNVEKQTFKKEITRDNEEEIKPLMLIRSINFQELQPIDYIYRVTDQEGETYLTGCETAGIAKLLQNKAVRKMLEQIYNALEEMSLTRRNVLNKRETNIVAETHWLLGVLKEMVHNCPQFLEVLFIVLGNNFNYKKLVDWCDNIDTLSYANKFYREYINNKYLICCENLSQIC